MMRAHDNVDGHEVVAGSGNAEADSAIIFLHGLGADCYDFAPLAEEFALPETVRTRFVFPNAPVRPVTLNGGMRMRAWYDLTTLDMDERSHDEQGIRDSVGLVRRLIAREEARGIRPERILVGGFSQGGAIAILAALAHAPRLAGLIALSTYLLFPRRVEAEVAAGNGGLPVFLAHGPADPIVPLRAGEYTRDRLRALGCAVEWRTYPMPHAVHPAEIADIGRFVTTLLPPPRPDLER